MLKLFNLSITDFKLIFRDSTLLTFLFLPVLFFALVIWGIPALLGNYSFLEQYLPLFLIVIAIENTQVFSFISSMVLIDEKEEAVAQVYGVVPLSNLEFIVSRLSFPYLFTVLLNVILLSIQPYFALPASQVLLLSLLTGLVMPVYALTINSIVDNRMQGMVYLKALNIFVLLPFGSFFLPEHFQWLFGVFPTYWVFIALEKALLQQSNTCELIVGFLFFGGLLFWTSKTFVKKHFR